MESEGEEWSPKSRGENGRDGVIVTVQIELFHPAVSVQLYGPTRSDSERPLFPAIDHHWMGALVLDALAGIGR